jgi:glutamate-5-semialdehyde dehydrogenase
MVWLVHRYVQNNTRIPVLGHADGICHMYLDKAANIELALGIIVDSKIQYPSACNALETLLVHHDVAATLLPKVVKALQEAKVEVRGDERTIAACNTASVTGVAPAVDKDWATEYCDLIISVKVVDSLDDAINHINTYGSRHTDGIITYVLHSCSLARLINDYCV